MEKQASKSSVVELEEWESLLRHQFFHKVSEAINQRVDSLQNIVTNRWKQPSGLEDSIKTAGDMRAICELNKITQLFESLKEQILQHKGVKKL